MEPQEVQLSHPARDPASATVVAEVRRVAPDVSALGDRLRFTGDLVARIEPFTRPGRVEIYHCPEGWLLYCYDSAKDNWACAGPTLEQMIGRLEEESLAYLVRAGLERSGHLAPR